MIEKRPLCEPRSRPHYFGWVAVLILLGGFGLRVWGTAQNSLWMDEASTVTYVQASAGQTLSYISEDAAQLPFYYMLLHLFPHDNELLLRAPSVLAGMLGIAVLLFSVIRLGGDYNLALVSAALLAVNPYHIWLSRTARVYSLFFVLALVNSCFFLILLQGDRRRVNWLIFMISGMAAYVTHHFALALPVVQYVLFAFILRGQRGFFRRWFRAQIAMGVPLLLWVINLVQRERVGVGAGWIPKPGLNDMGVTVWNMTLDYDGTRPWYIFVGLAAVVVGLTLGLYYAWRERKTRRADFYWLWLFVVPLVAAFVVSVTLRPLYVDRYFVIFLPALILLMLNGWQHIRWRAVSYALVGIVMAVNLVVVIDVTRDGEDEREDWRAAAQFIQQDYAPGDGLLVETPDRLLPLRYYWQGGLADYAWLSAGVDEAESLAEQYNQPVKRIWAVYRNPFDDGHRQGVMPDFDPFKPDDASPMPDWLASHRDQVLSTKVFKGVTVLLVDVHSEFPAAGN
jgi:mannosyltransferase